VNIQKVAKEYKHIKIRIYNETDNTKEKMRIVIYGVVDRIRYYVIENFTLPNTELSVDEAVHIIKTRYNGTCLKKIDYDNGRYSIELKVESIKRKQAVLEWIESIMLLYKLACIKEA
jgi:hypothetical protein